MRSFVRFVASLLVAAPVLLPAQGAPVSNNEWEVPWGASGRPRDPYVAPDGTVFFVGQTGNYIARLDPKSGQFTRFEIDSGTNPHTLIFDEKGDIWFTAQQSGAVGHLEVKTGANTRPYGIVINSKGIPWFNLFGTDKIATIDPATMEVKTFNLPNERAGGGVEGAGGDVSERHRGDVRGEN